MNNKKYFGNWEIVNHIGSGSFGDVYKIWKEEFGIVYYSAMKIIRIPQDKNEKKRLYSSGMDSASINDYYSQFTKDFIKEIELMAKLQGNTNIVGYNDHLIEENEDGVGYTIYIRMELLTPLDSYLIIDDKPRFMNSQEVVKLGIDICNALEICEKLNIIHRDIKPENIFVSGSGNFKLGDFGIARRLEKTQSGLSKKGTINYMAPEVYKGENYGASVDIYSLGIVLYRLLNHNRVPFMPEYPAQIKYTDSEMAFVKRLKGEAIPCIRGVDKELNDVIIKACEFKPDNRYRTASDLREALINISNYYSNNVERSLEDSVDIENTVTISGSTMPIERSEGSEELERTALIDDSFEDLQKTEVLRDVGDSNNKEDDIYVKHSKKGVILLFVALLVPLSIKT